MINLEIPKKLLPLLEQARTVADNVFRPISRKYDSLEHAYPKELDLLASLLDGLNEGGAGASASISNDAGGAGQEVDPRAPAKNGANMSAVLGMMEVSRGDVGLALTIPRQGLGNAALAAVGTKEQKEKYGKLWIAHGHHRAVGRVRLCGDSRDRPPRGRRVGPQRREDLRHRG